MHGKEVPVMTCMERASLMKSTLHAKPFSTRAIHVTVFVRCCAWPSIDNVSLHPKTHATMRKHPLTDVHERCVNYMPARVMPSDKDDRTATLQCNASDCMPSPGFSTGSTRRDTRTQNLKAAATVLMITLWSSCGVKAVPALLATCCEGRCGSSLLESAS